MRRVKVMAWKKGTATVLLAGGMFLGLGGTAFADGTASGAHPNGNAACFGHDTGTGVGDASIQKNNLFGTAVKGAATTLGGVGSVVEIYQADCPRNQIPT